MIKKFLAKIKENDEKKRKEDEEKKENLIRAFKFFGDTEEESLESANTIIRIKLISKYIFLVTTAIFVAYIIHDLFLK